MKYYLAYGSNINKEQMDIRCPDNKVIGTAILKKYELAFHKYLTVEPNENKECPVVVYQISESDERILDQKEGVNYHTYRKEYIDIEIDGKHLKCLIYIMNDLPDRRNVPPSSVYLKTCIDGYKRYGFNPDYILQAKNYKKTDP